jgi:hypothetical protein
LPASFDQQVKVSHTLLDNRRSSLRTVTSGINRANSISPSPSCVTPQIVPDGRKHATSWEDEADSSRTVASRCGSWLICGDHWVSRRLAWGTDRTHQVQGQADWQVLPSLQPHALGPAVDQLKVHSLASALSTLHQSRETLVRRHPRSLAQRRRRSPIPLLEPDRASLRYPRSRQCTPRRQDRKVNDVPSG